MATDFVWNDAVQQFWDTRELQSQKQVNSGKIDAGNRGAVTGGGHLDALQAVIADLFRKANGIQFDVRSARSDGIRTIPGFFRPAKDWDIIVLYQNALVAAIELKSQSGSFGNNFNNRAEEAIGNALDLRSAFRAGLLGSIQPWLGYVIVIEATDVSTAPRRVPTTAFPIEPKFYGTSYLDRYRILTQRLVATGMYDAAVVVASERGHGIVQDRENTLSLANFESAVKARIEYVKTLIEGAFTEE